MIDQVTRLVVNWMTDPTNGLSAQLPTVPRATDVEAPNPAEIFNALDHDWVARGRAPADKLTQGTILTIAAAVNDQQPVQFGMLPQRQQGNAPEVPIEITAILASSATARQRSEAGMLLRASLRVITTKFESHDTTYTLDGIVIRLGDTPAGLFTQLIDQGDNLLRGAITVPFAVLDRWALGIT